MNPRALLIMLLVGCGTVATSGAPADASWRAILSNSGITNALREDYQRPIDARLLKIEAMGAEESGLFTGTIHRVRTGKEVQALSGKLNPGDQLVLAGSVWKDTKFTFSGQGTEAAPILIRPEEPGDVVFTGDSGVTFEGAHLMVTGLEFRNIVVTNRGTVIFRLGAGTNRPAHHCVLNHIKIVDCNSPDPADWPRVRMWYLLVDGHDNTVANSTFANMKHYGQMLAAQDLPPKELQRLHILNNRFTNRPKIDDQNGYEIIQLGWSGEHARPSGSLIQENLFERCDGEDEIITIKASDVFLRDNAFMGCQGALNLREANRVLVQGNFFDGRGRTNTGGVRIEGADHVIVDNTFRNLKAPRNYYFWTLSLMAASAENASDDVEGYGRAKNIVIAQNRFENNDTRIAVGTYPRPNYPLLPQDVWVKDNVFVGGTNNSPFDFLAPDPTGAMRKSIRESGNRFVQ